MKTPRLLLVPFLLAAVAALAAGCGGGGPNSVPADSVAVVGSTPISKSDFNGLITVALARYKAQGQAAPKPGTDPYNQLRDQAVTYLVQEQELQQEAQKMGVSVSQKDIDGRLTQIKQQYYGGSETKLEAALKKDDISVSDLQKYNIAPQLLSEKLYSKVTSGVNVSKDDAQKYYDTNKATYRTPPTREVRHILVNSKGLADQLEAQLKKDPTRFPALAKKYSKDTASAQQGGKMCVAHGANSGACITTVPPFDKASFSLKTNEISQPVHSPFGWHIIQPLTPVQPAKTQPFSQVEAQIQQSLIQSKKGQAWSAWLAKLRQDFKGKIAYQSGYTPATTSTATAPAATTTGP